MGTTNDNKTKKGGKPGSRPARALTAYNFYFHDQRQKLQGQLLQFNGQRPTYTQISRLVGQSWKKVNVNERAHYEALASKDKRRYALELVRNLEETGTEKQDHVSIDMLTQKKACSITTSDIVSPPSVAASDSFSPLESYGVNPYSPSLQAMLRQSMGDPARATPASLISMNPEIVPQIHLLSLMMIDYVKRVAPEKLDALAATSPNSNKAPHHSKKIPPFTRKKTDKA
jgi:hypothetical protein